jgi:hypothetical protein
LAVFLLCLDENLTAHKIRSDTDLAPPLDAAKPHLADIEAQLEAIRLKALRQPAAAPSPFGFINSRLGAAVDVSRNVAVALGLGR